MLDVEPQLRALCEHLDESVPAVGLDEALGTRLRPSRADRHPPGWLAASATAVVVLVVVGAVAWLLSRGSPRLDDEPPTRIAPPATATTTTMTAPATTDASTPTPTAGPSPATTAAVLSTAPVDGSSLGTTLTVGERPGHIQAGFGALWIDDLAGLVRLDPSTLDVSTVEYGRSDPTERQVRIGSSGIWVRDPFWGDVARVDPEERVLPTGWLLPDGVDYVSDVAVRGDALWLAAISPGGSEELVHLDLEGSVVSRSAVDGYALESIATTADAVWVVASRQVSAPAPPFVVLRIDPGSGAVETTIELDNLRPSFYFNDPIIAAGGFVFLSGYVCECPDPPEPGAPLGRVVRIDPATNTVTTATLGGVTDPGVDLGLGPFTDLVQGDGLLWGVRLVGDFDDREVVRIDPTTLEVVGGPIRFDTAPWAVAVAHGRLWVTHPASGEVTVVDVAALR